jgi:cytolysin (calcineurin-like family phosphatase)
MNATHSFSRRRFLGQSALLTGLPQLAAQAAADERASFFLVGDTHYRASDDDNSVLDPVSADYNRRLIDWLNRLPGTEFAPEAGGGAVSAPHGVIHAGDIVDNGDKGAAVAAKKVPIELSSFLGDWGLNGGDARLRWPVREVHGNHDSPQGAGLVIDEIKARNGRRKDLVNVSENGLHYSWDWAGVHFVALGIVVGDAPEVTRKRRYQPQGSLPFLRRDLAEHVGDSGRPVVLAHHVDVARYSTAVPDEKAIHQEWDYGDAQAYHATLKPYRVAAALCGHTHARNLFRWNGTADQKAKEGLPFLNTDNAGHFHSESQAFLHIEISQKETVVREFATADGWQTGAWRPQQWRFAF